MVSVPDGWTEWSDGGDGRVVWVYRPDVFDSEAFPAPCLPTIYVSRQSPGARRRRVDPGDEWHVALFVEPEVRVQCRDATRDDRASALEAARDLARDFAAGDVDYRGAYQVPRAAYLDRLDALTGREA